MVYYYNCYYVVARNCSKLLVQGNNIDSLDINSFKGMLKGKGIMIFERQGGARS